MDRRNFLSVPPSLAFQNRAYYENGLMNYRNLFSRNPTIGARNRNISNSVPFGVRRIDLNQRSTEVRKTYVTPNGIQVRQSVMDHSKINNRFITTVTEVTTTKYVLPTRPNFRNHINPSVRPSIFNPYHQPILKNLINSIDNRASKINGVDLNKPAGLMNSSCINNEAETMIERRSGDGKTHSLPHKKYGPYKCPKCKRVFKISQQFAAHMMIHYRDESVEERKRRLEIKYGVIKKPRLVCSGDGLIKEEEVDGDNGVKKEEGSNEEAIFSNVDGANVDVKAEEQNL